jgi:uncharacterized DUF497 family protein
MLCIYNGDAVFDWDENNLRKIRAHRVKRADVEQALSNGPILIYEQSVGGEARFVYYGETDVGRLLAVVLTERDDRIRVVTAYRLDAGQKRDFFARRLRGE